MLRLALAGCSKLLYLDIDKWPMKQSLPRTSALRLANVYMQTLLGGTNHFFWDPISPSPPSSFL